MKTYQTTNGNQFTVNSARQTYAGYGHKTIYVEICFNGEYEFFTKVTNNMPDFDDAMDLEGQERAEALFDLVHYSLYSEIEERISNL